MSEEQLKKLRELTNFRLTPAQLNTVWEYVKKETSKSGLETQLDRYDEPYDDRYEAERDKEIR